MKPYDRASVVECSEGCPAYSCVLQIKQFKSCSFEPPFGIVASSSRRTMGCCPSKHDASLTTATTRQEMSQGPRSPVALAPPVAKAASRSSQRSRANSEHRSQPGRDVSNSERPRSNSNPTQKRQPPINVPPVPSHVRNRALTITPSSTKNTSTPPSGPGGECYRRWSA